LASGGPVGSGRCTLRAHGQKIAPPDSTYNPI
jgi:hypothetical protein